MALCGSIQLLALLAAATPVGCQESDSLRCSGVVVAGYGAPSRAAVVLEVLVVWSFVYLALRRVLELMVRCWMRTRLSSWSCVTSWQSCAASPTASAPAQRPRAAGGAEPPAAQAAMVQLGGHARDAASMAPSHGLIHEYERAA